MNALTQTGFIPGIKLEKTLSRWMSSLILLFFSLAVLVSGLSAMLIGGHSMLVLLKVFTAGFILDLIYWLFLDRLKQPHRTLDPDQPASLLDFQAAIALYNGMGPDQINTKQLLLRLSSDLNFQWVLSRLNIPPQRLRTEIEEKYPGRNISVEELLHSSLAYKNPLGQLDVASLLRGLAAADKSFYDLLFALNIDDKRLARILDWQRRRLFRQRQKLRFWDPEQLLRIRGIGKNWSAAYTPNLDNVGSDISLSVEVYPPAFIYGHKRYIEQIERLLVDGLHNVVLVGPPGVGRHAVVQNLAAMINRGDVLRPLQYIRLIQIDSSSILTSELGGAKEIDKIHLLFSEAMWSGNVILVINNFDALLDPKPEVGRINASEALLPFLRSKLRIIGLTTQAGYQATIGKNPELAQVFGKIEVTEPDFDETLVILQDHADTIEHNTNLKFTEAALEEIVTLATKLIQNLPNPEKSLEILQAAAVFANTKTSMHVVTVEHVQKIISDRTQIPVEKVTSIEKDVLMHLEDLLHERIVGQNEAISEISNALRRARAGIRSDKRPIGSFLFLGPTGVGKTETTKALAAVYFGSEKRIVRLDMSEFQEVHSLNRLIGDQDQDTGGLLTEEIIARPFSLILLDEIEKAHPKILDLFLQVLDEGRLTDAFGRTVDFTNTMIIATSNAGAETIREAVKSKAVNSKEQVMELIQKQRIFRPEFLNRFDGIVLFNPLTADELKSVAALGVKDLNRRLEEKQVSVVPSPELLEFIVKHSYSPEFGARPIRRFVTEHLENYVAEGLISGRIKRGDKIEFTAELLANI